MIVPEVLPEQFVNGIKELSIDASSIIYLLKMGILGYVAAEIDLVTSDRIIREVDWPHLPIQIHTIHDDTLTNDETVVILAEKKGIPVLSEDFEVLKNAGQRGLSYYNTLMILNYLLLKKRIDKKEYPIYLRRLIEISHYSQEIIDYGEGIKILVDRELIKENSLHADQNNN